MGTATGMTALTTSFTQPDQLRIAIADQRGDGRPDFNYQARVLYADSVTSGELWAPAGGTVTITGMGFRTGNAVLVNGVAATVSSWTANTIVAAVPSLRVRWGRVRRWWRMLRWRICRPGERTVMTRSVELCGRRCRR